MKLRIIKRYNHDREFPYVLQRKILGIVWIFISRHSGLENAFEAMTEKLDRHINRHKLEVWYSKDALIDAMHKVKKGDE